MDAIYASYPIHTSFYIHPHHGPTKANFWFITSTASIPYIMSPRRTSLSRFPKYYITLGSPKTKCITQDKLHAISVPYAKVRTVANKHTSEDNLAKRKTKADGMSFLLSLNP